MEITKKRKKLHEYIELADDPKVDALFLILESDKEKPSSYSAEDISMFYERRERHLKGEGKSFSIKDSFDYT
jgi:hypothetical protein